MTISMPIKAIAFDAYGTLFDPASVSRAVEAAFPGHGEFIGAVWRQKQLEYTWQRTAMDAFTDFATVTREALAYAIRTVRPEVESGMVESVCEAFDRLDLAPEATEAIGRLAGHRLAVLSNGTDAMLAALLRHAGIASFFPTVVSSDRVRAYKPHPAFYRALVEELALPAAEIALVSGNGFDLAGARRFGLTTIRIERVPPDRMRAMTQDGAAIAPAVPFVALRSQMDAFAGPPHHVCADLNGVVDIARREAAAA